MGNNVRLPSTWIDGRPFLMWPSSSWYRLPGESPDQWDERIGAALLTERQKRSEELAREVREREELEAERLAEELDFRQDLDAFLLSTLPDRSARRARALHVMCVLKSAGHCVEFRHGDVRVTPEPTDPLAGAVNELRSELSDLLEEERHER